MTREINPLESVPEGIGKTQEKGQEEITRLLNRSEGQFSPELQETLEKIDFVKLRQLFLDIALRFGIYEDDLNFLDKKRIFGSAVRSVDSYYDLENNIIMITQDKANISHYEARLKLKDNTGLVGDEKMLEVLNREKKAMIETYGSVDLSTLQTLVHEEVHAISKHICKSLYEQNVDKWTDVWLRVHQSGYRRNNIYKKQLNAEFYPAPLMESEKFLKVFMVLNEAVVEKLAREIMLKYLENSGWPREEASVFEETVKNKSKPLSYAREVYLLEAIIKKLSQKTKKSEESVWQIFIKGLLEGEKFDRPEERKIFEKNFSPNFLKELSNLSTWPSWHSKRHESIEELKAFMERYKL